MSNTNYVAALSFRIGADTQQFLSGMQKFNQKVNDVGASLQRAGAYASAFTAAFTGIAVSGLNAWDKQVKAIAQVEQGLKSTGNQVGFTSKQLQDMASELQNNTLFGDEEILQGATAQLLTFTNIAGDQFARTQQAALDLATRLDGDLKSASIQLGKALNDPIANLSALSRSGIQFSQDQKAVIKSLTEAGRLAEAQNIILDELQRQYGGSAAAAAAAGTGGLKQLSNSFGDLTERVGEVVYEFLAPFIKKAKDIVDTLNKADPAIIRTGVVIGGLAAAIGPLLLGVGSMIRLLPTLASGFAAITGPVGITVAAIAGLAFLVLKYVDVFGVANDLMVGDSQKAYASLKNSFKLFANDMIEIYSKLYEAFLYIGEKLYSALGIDGAAKGFSDARKSLNDFTNGLKLDAVEGVSSLDKLKKAYEDFQKALNGFGFKPPPIIPDPPPGAGEGTGSPAFNKSPIAALASKGIAQSTPSLKQTSEQARSVQGLEGDFTSIPTQLETIRLSAQLLGDTFGGVEEQIRFLEYQMVSLIENGMAPADPVIQAIHNKLEGLKSPLQGLKIGFAQVGAQLQQTFVQGEAGLKDFTKEALNSIRQVIKAFIAKGIAGIVAESLGSAPGPIGLAIAAAAGAGAAALFNTIIPKFADGGIINKPTLGIIGEAGPEAIVPLNNRGAAFMRNAGAGSDINFKGDFRMDGDDLRLVVERSTDRFNMNT